MKTLKDTHWDKATRLRLVNDGKQFVGLAFVNGKERLRLQGEGASEVWEKLTREVGKANPQYFGYDGARNRFLHFFPNGFHSAGYANEERTYKLAAKAKLDQHAPLAEAVEGSDFGEAVLSAFRATNLLSPFEKTRLQGALRGPTADPFIRAAARFTVDPGQRSLNEMEQALKREDVAKWTAVTYLPFLWRPDAHMFLKPEVTKDFATRVGHRFASDYEPRLRLDVYQSLVNLAAETEVELADLQPRDRIDVQSFIWVVGDYKDDRETPKP